MIDEVLGLTEFIVGSLTHDVMHSGDTISTEGKHGEENEQSFIMSKMVFLDRFENQSPHGSAAFDHLLRPFRDIFPKICFDLRMIGRLGFDRVQTGVG